MDVSRPEYMISSEALFERAAKLPRVEFSKPKSVITKDTVSAMQAGIMFGYAGLIDGIVERMKAEIKTNTDGNCHRRIGRVVAPETKCIDKIEDMLTLEGLRIIYNLNSKS